MTTNIKIVADSQDMGVGSAYLDLFKIDLSKQGGLIYYVAGGTLDGDPIEYDGNEYTPIPIKIEGLEKTGDGKFPRPNVSISNVSLSLLAEIIAYNDFQNCLITVTRVYEKYLDGQPGADTNAHYPSESFRVNRKVKQNKEIIQFELISPLDLEYIRIPKRQCLTVCQHNYRLWDTGGGDFDYASATCPYTDSTAFFNIEGEVEGSGADDKCGKKLVDCKLRFGTVNQLPMRAFPGIGAKL